jgi:4-hydroxy-tetrahydrodipicolinate synthase
MIGDTPVVLQDFPGSTGVWMSVPSILRLIESFPQIMVVKEEDVPSLEKISQLRAGQGRRVQILTGNNGLYLPYEMARGIDGPMAGFSHPEMLSGVYQLYIKGEIEAAHDLFDIYLPLLDYEAQGFWGVAARKEVMRRRGAIRHATMRHLGLLLAVSIWPRSTSFFVGWIDPRRGVPETPPQYEDRRFVTTRPTENDRSNLYIDGCRFWLGLA